MESFRNLTCFCVLEKDWIPEAQGRTFRRKLERGLDFAGTFKGQVYTEEIVTYKRTFWRDDDGELCIGRVRCRNREILAEWNGKEWVAYTPGPTKPPPPRTFSKRQLKRWDKKR